MAEITGIMYEEFRRLLGPPPAILNIGVAMQQGGECTHSSRTLQRLRSWGSLAAR